MVASNKKTARRWEKLYDKLISESGPRWQNRIEREQRIAKLRKNKPINP